MNGLTSFDRQRFDDFVFERMSETMLPSVAVSIIENGEVVHTRGYGFRDVGAALPASPNTLYGIGSITKSFTALSIARLVESGRLDFHDPITKFLRLRPRAFEGVEIHHLLTHTSGLPGLGSSEVLSLNTVGEHQRWIPISSLGDMTSFLSDVDDWVEAKPGEQLFYLNEGYLLLGEVVSRVSGKPYERFVLDEIFGPLGMKRTFFSKEQISADTDTATPYLIRDGNVRASVVPYGFGAAGGIVSNAVDLSNYVTMFINRGELDGKRIVDKETLEKMETPYAEWPLERYGGDSYGYGLQVVPDFHGHKVVGHGGSVDVYTASFSCVRDLKIGSVFLANGKGYSMGVLSMGAIALMMGEDPEGLLPVSTELLLKRLEGRYGAYKNTISAEVRRSGSFLLLSGEDIGNGIVLVPEKHGADGATFFTLDGGAKMEVQFRFNRYGIEMLYERYKYRRTGPLRPQQPT